MSERDEFFDRAERQKLERDFFAEAEQIFDGLTADLTALEAGLGRDGASPAVVNRMFRGVHSLKGLSGSLGIDDVSALAHAVETVMDRLRLAPERLDAATLDALHDGVDQLSRLVRDRRAGGRGGRPIAALVERLRSVGGAGAEGTPAPGAASAGALLRRLDLDAGLRAALSEHEEGRLEAHLRAGRPVRLVRLRLPPEGFDEPLRSVVAWLGERAEILSTIPESVTGEEARFAILTAGAEPIEPSAAPLAGLEASVRICALLDDGPGPSAGSEAVNGDDELRGLSDTLRVPVARLDQLLSQTGDLGIACGAVAAAARRLREAHPGDRLAADLDRQAGRLLPRLAALQRATLEARLVPFEQLFARLTRMVARAARSAGKEVDLHTMGGDTEIDKAVSDELAAPLLHLLRNGLDHGLEPPAERLAARKPRRGRLVLCAFRRGGRVLLEVSDDGRGIDPAAVRAAAERRGLLPPGAPLTSAEVVELIFRPGFSTASTVSEGSGRGVGLDAVGAALRRLKGTIEPRTIAGQGTTFTLSVPLSLSLVRALIVVAGGRRFAIPLGDIRENLRLDPARLRGSAGKAESYDRPGGSLPLVRLRTLFGAADGAPAAAGLYAVIASAGGRDLGIVIDGFAGQQEIVVKPIGAWARELPGISGATDLGDATAVLVLDPESLPPGGARAGAA